MKRIYGKRGDGTIVDHARELRAKADRVVMDTMGDLIVSSGGYIDGESMKVVGESIALYREAMDLSIEMIEWQYNIIRSQEETLIRIEKKLDGLNK